MEKPAPAPAKNPGSDRLRLRQRWFKEKGLEQHTRRLTSRQEGQHLVKEYGGLLVAECRVLKQAIGQVPFAWRKSTDQAVPELFVGVGGGPPGPAQ